MDWAEVERVLGRVVEAIDAGELDAAVALREQLRGAVVVASLVAVQDTTV